MSVGPCFRLDGVGKSLGREAVLHGISLAVDQGELVALIGPSGVGKTTLLQIVAGLLAPDAGRVVFAEPPTKSRPVLLVFQDYLLFPSMTVAQNVAFGLASRGESKAAQRDKVDRQLAYFQLADKAGAYPAELSAGQKQRVAIARALVLEPAVLLLDEPFANLDRNLKMETARFLRQTQREFGITMLAVTHDLEEAFVMSDRMGIMLDGKLAQYDTPAAIYAHPANLAVARFLGPVNRLPAPLASRLAEPELAARLNGSPAHVRPEGLSLRKAPQGLGLVQEVSFVGHYVIYRVVMDTEGAALTVYGLDPEIHAGDRVDVTLHTVIPT